jgi:hypothetical protein
MIPNSTLLSLPSIGEQMAEIFQSTRDGCATDEDMKRLKILSVSNILRLAKKLRM